MRVVALLNVRQRKRLTGNVRSRRVTNTQLTAIPNLIELGNRRLVTRKGSRQVIDREPSLTETRPKERLILRPDIARRVKFLNQLGTQIVIALIPVSLIGGNQRLGKLIRRQPHVRSVLRNVDLRVTLKMRVRPLAERLQLVR